MIKKVTIYIITTTFITFVGCTKDKVPFPETEPEPTKWELITGNYKVYDSLGSYLYEMNIFPIGTDEFNNDSLKFENFDGEFTFTSKQTNFTNYEFYTRIGSHDLLFDNQVDRWKIGSAIYEEYNQFKDDTIHLRFQKTNINYYLLDLVPFFSCDCKQIAVKQH